MDDEIHHQEHQDEPKDEAKEEGVPEAPESAENVRFGAHYSKAPAGCEDGPEDYKAGGSVDSHPLNPFLPFKHVLPKLLLLRGEGIHKARGEEGLVEEFLRVRVHKVRAAAAKEECIRVGIWLYGR